MDDNTDGKPWADAKSAMRKIWNKAMPKQYYQESK